MNVTLQTMLSRLEGMLGTSDLTEWQQQFVRSVLARSDGGKRTSLLTGKQVEVVEQLFSRHFAA